MNAAALPLTRTNGPVLGLSDRFSMSRVAVIASAVVAVMVTRVWTARDPPGDLRLQRRRNQQGARGRAVPRTATLGERRAPDADEARDAGQRRSGRRVESHRTQSNPRSRWRRPFACRTRSSAPRQRPHSSACATSSSATPVALIAALLWAFDVNAIAINRIGKEDTFAAVLLPLGRLVLRTGEAAGPTDPPARSAGTRPAARLSD